VIIRTSAPTRIDLAGGTIDIWPLYLFHPGAQTLNAAISLRAHASIRETIRGSRSNQSTPTPSSKPKTGVSCATSGNCDCSACWCTSSRREG
jgi:galactokinase/mevalonate kinase-like predicted kinase